MGAQDEKKKLLLHKILENENNMVTNVQSEFTIKKIGFTYFLTKHYGRQIDNSKSFTKDS